MTNPTTGHTYEWTSVGLANQLGSDSPVVPVPVHVCCIENRKLSGYQRIRGAERFVPYGTHAWAGPSLPAGSICYFCGTEI